MTDILFFDMETYTKGKPIEILDFEGNRVVIKDSRINLVADKIIAIGLKEPGFPVSIKLIKSPEEEEGALMALLARLRGKTVVGFNVKAFDLTMLWYAALKYNTIDLKEIETHIQTCVDLMHILKPYKYAKFPKCGSLAFKLGYPYDDDNGSQIRELHDHGDWEAIMRHLKRDLERNELLYNKAKERGLL